MYTLLFFKSEPHNFWSLFLLTHLFQD